MKNEFLKTREEIEAWLNAKFINNFTIELDAEFGWAVNVKGSVNLSGKLEKCYLPVKFKRVCGDFTCTSNYLTSLRGAPEYVEGTFDATDNQLKTLKFAPNTVIRNFICSQNSLINLKWAPTNKMQLFDCSSNDIVSLVGAPKIIQGHFFCLSNKLTSLKYCPQKVLALNCSFNDIDTIEYLPQICTSDTFVWTGNSKLKSIINKTTNDFSYIKNIQTAMKEKKKLENGLAIKANGVIHKI